MKNSSPQGLKAGSLKRKTAMARGFAASGSARYDKHASRGSRNRKSGISPASPAQRKKVRELPCLVCGGWSETHIIDPAHVIPRSLGGCDHPDCVVALCRLHHREVDAGRIDLLPLLEPYYRAEQAHAVLHVGLENVRVRTAPSCYRGAG